MDNEIIGSIGDFTIRYFGKVLNITDMLVWCVVKKLCVDDEEFQAIVGIKDILKLLDKDDNGKNREWLIDHLLKFRQASITVSGGKYSAGYVFNLFKELTWDKKHGRFYVQLDKRILPFFSDNEFTYVRLSFLLKLKKDITKKMFSYFESHGASVYPMYDTKYQLLCGSTSAKKDFRKNMKAGLKELRNLGYLFTYDVERSGLTSIQKKRGFKC